MKISLHILAICLLLSGLSLQAGGGASQKNPPEAGPITPYETSPPRPARDVLLKLSKDVIDPLKKKVDEWGTLAFAPLMLAPPAYTGPAPDGSGTNSRQTPFNLDEKKNLAQGETNPFTLNELYKAQNVTNGQSLFGQRTQTKTSLSAELDTSAVVKALVEGKLKLLNASQSKVQQGAAVQQALTQTQLATAQQNLQKAQAAATAADAQVAVAMAATNQARTTALAAVQATVGQQGQALADANAQQALADLAMANTAADLKQAMALQSNAHATLLTAQAAIVPAQSAAVDAQKAALTLPADASLPSTTSGSGSAAPVDNSLKNLSFPDMRTLTGVDTLNKANAGMNSTTLPVKTLAKPETKDAGSFPPLARINNTASVLTVKNILHFLGDPSSAMNFDGKRLLFAVSSLSVNPGWRTREGFKAVITGDIRIRYEVAHRETVREMLNSPDYPPGLRKLIADRYPGFVTAAQKEFFKRYDDLPADKKPKLSDYSAYLKTEPAVSKMLEEKIVVTAVSPMVDAQNLELSSSIARQEELALMLSASLAQAGSAGAANFFSSWVKLRRKDASTLNSVATANSFSTGDRFGFEVGTRLRGLDEEDANGKKAAQILDRQTIPVLFILGITDAVARPVLLVDDKTLNFSVKQPKLEFGYSTRWTQQQRSFWSFLKPNPQRSLQKSQGEILSNALIRKAAENVDLPDAQTQEVKDVMTREYDFLVKNLYGAEYSHALPARWLLNNLGPTILTDADLHDPLAEIASSTLTFDPPKLAFTKLGETATLVIRGSSMQQLDGTGILVTGGGVVRDTTKDIIQTQDALFLKVKAVSISNDPVIFHLPYKGTSALTGLSSRPILKTLPLECRISVTELPEIADWTETSLLVDGDFTNNAWRKDKVQVILRGTNLDQLVAAQSTALRGVGISNGAVPVAISVREHGPNAAVVEFPLASVAGRGEIILQFNLGKFGVFSKPLPFQFKDAVSPAISPWDPGDRERLLLSTVTGNQRSATLQIRLRGQALQRLGVPEVKPSFACKTKIVVKSAEPEVMLIEISFTEVLVDSGTLYLAFLNKTQFNALPTLSDTMTVQFRR